MLLFLKLAILLTDPCCIFCAGSTISLRDKQQAAIRLINSILNENAKSLTDYPSLPQVDDYEIPDVSNRLVLKETSYDRKEQAAISIDLISKLNCEQKVIFDKIMQASESDGGGFFFVHGFGGTGKTFLWNSLAATLRAEGKIVVAVASSGIAATLLPSGSTAHSRFAIPIDVNESSTCSIGQAKPLAELLRVTRLIIWDEAPMVQRYCIEAFDRSLRDIMHSNRVFGGKCIIMGGDFRQILPVIRRGSRATIIDSCINLSNLWAECTVFHLTMNMRLTTTRTNVDKEKIRMFSRWLLSISDGCSDGGFDGKHIVSIPT